MERVVFVSNEILLGEIPAYAGGLGILSGGIVSSARDTAYPLLGITLVHDQGYVRHEIENREVKFLPDPYEPREFFTKIDRKFFIELKDFRIWFRVWEHKLSEEVSVFFIDSNVKENPEYLRRLTSRVYIEDTEEEKLLKRLLLGLGALKIVEELKIPCKKFHLNESHCGFLAMELLKKEREISRVRKKIVFTTHTPLPHGHEKFSYSLVERYYEIPEKVKVISPGVLDVSRVLFVLAGYKNAVSWKHWLLLKRYYPNIDFDYITNGVHTKWIEDEMRKLYDRFIPGWFAHPHRFAHAGVIDLEELGKAKENVKRKLIYLVNTQGYYNKSFDESGITLVARRRITGYKRNDIFFRDVERIESISRKYNLQILVSGVCHPKDVEGRKILQNLVELMSVLSHTKLALLLRNGKKYERACVAGGDLFVHASLPPFEACGTSWMRAALNAVPTLASKDGGVVEAVVHNYNGFLFGKNRFEAGGEEWEDVADFYEVLENVLSMFRNEREEYLRVCRNALKTIGALFNTNRVLREYIKRAYEK